MRVIDGKAHMHVIVDCGDSLVLKACESQARPGASVLHQAANRPVLEDQRRLTARFSLTPVKKSVQTSDHLLRQNHAECIIHTPKVMLQDLCK